MSRIITALIVLPVLIASILISWLAPLFVALALAAMVLGLYEFWLLAKRRGMKPDVVIGFVGAAALFTIFYFDKTYENSLLLLLLVMPVLTIALLTAAMLRGAPYENMMASVGATVLGVMYVALLGGHLVAVRTGFEQKLSSHLLSFFFLVIMGADTGAYYTGRLLGRHKLAPKISPGKTWEGAWGGIAGAALYAMIGGTFLTGIASLPAYLAIAVVLAAISIVGDLFESAAKRQAEVKDSGTLLPGHGGILDRIDSATAVLPVAALVFFYSRP